MRFNIVGGICGCLALLDSGCLKTNESTQVTAQPEVTKVGVDESRSQAPAKPGQEATKPTGLETSVTASTTRELPKRTEPEAVAVLRAYIAATKWQDRLSLVRSSNRVGPYMQTAYAKYYKGFQNENIRIFPSEPKPVAVGGWVALSAEWNDVAYAGSRKQLAEYIIYRTRDGFKVDWEASVGYNPTKLSVFVAKQGDEPVSFRVSCKLSNYYNSEYRMAKSTHYSIEIKADGKDIYGFIPRNSADGKRVFDLLEDGETHPLMLQLQHAGPRGETMKDPYSNGTYVAITKLISNSWVMPE
jgi:hypothetical protein